MKIEVALPDLDDARLLQEVGWSLRERPGTRIVAFYQAVAGLADVQVIDLKGRAVRMNPGDVMRLYNWIVRHRGLSDPKFWDDMRPGMDEDLAPGQVLVLLDEEG